VEAVVLPSTKRRIVGLNVLNRSAPVIFSVNPPELVLSPCTVKELAEAEISVPAILLKMDQARAIKLLFSWSRLCRVQPGPRALTFAEAVETIADASGGSIRYRQIPHRTFLDGLATAGVSQEFVELLDELFSVVLDGRNSPVMEGVQEVLGQQARDFTTYARETAAAGFWNATP